MHAAVLLFLFSLRELHPELDTDQRTFNNAYLWGKPQP